MPIFRQPNIAERMANQNGFVSGKDPNKVYQQLLRERQYNHDYYARNKERILAQRHSSSKKIPYGNQTKQQLTKQIKSSNPSMYDIEAEDYATQKILSSHFSPKFNQANADAANQRRVNTGIGQGAQVRASELQKRQNQSLSRVSMSDSKASQAQMDTRNKVNRNRRIREASSAATANEIAKNAATKIKKSHSALASNAYTDTRKINNTDRKKRKHLLQVQGDYIRNQSAARSANETNAYKTSRDAEVKSRKKRKHFLQVQGDYIRNQSAARSANEVNAYSANRKKQKEYNNSFEGRLSRAMNRSAKRTANVTNNINKFFDILGRVSKNSYRNYKRYTS